MPELGSLPEGVNKNTAGEDVRVPQLVSMCEHNDTHFLGIS